VIAHLVLFRPKADLKDNERQALIEALAHAIANIPLIARAHIGRRKILGRQYDSINTLQFPYAAILEFDSELDLRAYLDHPAHERLGEQFYFTSESALAFDFEMLGPDRARELLA
jgi:Stress responsive A/B Barrel Domain